MDWANRKGIELCFIEPGKPTQNAFVESFNGKFRNECLNCYWFKSMKEVRRHIEYWVDDYNNRRPHMSLGYKPPAEYARAL